jgi:hypothetical protein
MILHGEENEMSGTAVRTTVGLDAIAQMVMDRISYFKIGEGGFTLSSEVTEIIEESATGTESTYTHTVSGGDFSVIGVDAVANEFEISGEHADFFPDGALVKVENSSGNDGNYTVAPGGATESGGNTFIVVNEDFTDSTPDGLLYVSRLPVAIGPTDDAKHFPLVVEEVTPGLVVVQTMTDTTGSGTLTGNGTGSVNYKNGSLSVTFTSPVAIGNIVRVRFKYHDLKKDASAGVAYTELESESSPLAADGNPELFTFTKSFGADADTKVEFRGVGYATVRCTIKLQAVEGIDDGRGATYGGTPYYFEGGIFDDNDVMLGYFTFDKQRKVAPLEVVHTFDFIF